MLNCLVADTLTRIRNGSAVCKEEVRVYYSKLIVNILKLLKREGYILGYSVVDNDEGKYKYKEIVVNMSYINGKASFRFLKQFSKNSLPVYLKAKDVLSFSNRYGYSGLETICISSSRGVISGFDAIKKNVGGKVLFCAF